MIFVIESVGLRSVGTMGIIGCFGECNDHLNN